MPTYFQLYRRDTGEAQFFQTIDRELCQNLELPFSEERYTCDWYNTIGLMLALGHSFDYITDRLRETQSYHLLRINHYLMEHYGVDAWHKVGRG